MSDFKFVYTLNAEQLTALRTFANANGHNWKSVLDVAWSTGRYGEMNEYGLLLTQTLNTFGSSWLVKFSFDNIETHSVKY